MLDEGYLMVESEDRAEPPAPQQEWDYGALRHLASGLPPDVEGSRVDVCVYRVKRVCSGTPFVLLALHSDANELRWPRHAATTSAGVIPGAERLVVGAFAALGPAAAYRGWRHTRSGTQLWFQLECAHDHALDVRSLGGWRWALASEIVNEGHVAGDHVHAEVQRDVASCPDIGVLYCRVTGAPSPPVQAGFYCGPTRALGYAAAVGSRRAGPVGPFGEHYYLDSYERAVAVLNAASDRHAMVRYAVTTGRQAMLLGRSTDAPDASAMTRHLGMVRPIVRASAKARDAESKWARECDSVARGRLAVEVGGARHTMEPRMCVHDVAGFLPLEFCGSGAPPPSVSSTLSYTPEHEHVD